MVYVATTHNWPALLRDIPLAASVSRTGPPVVLHLHGSECAKLGQPGQGTFTVLSSWLMERVAAVLVLSREELETWRLKCPRARFELVLNPLLPVPGVGFEQLAASRESAGTRRQTVLFIGRLVPDKGIFELLDAFAVVRRSRDCSLTIAGVGPVGGEVARRVAVMGLSQDVQLVGYLTGDALDHAYRSADVFVLPSYREGFPLTVMEAMGYGLPVVTTPIRGCADHLVEGVNALFVPPRDVETLARRLLELLDDDALRLRMGEANVRKVAEFAPEAVVARYAEILRSVVVDEGVRA